MDNNAEIAKTVEVAAAAAQADPANYRGNLPLYQCHKRVRAVKIGAVLLYDGDDKIRIKPADKSIQPFVIPENSYQKHQPSGGGYWVIYDDGYQSYSPAEAFESGYVLASDHAAFRRAAVDQIAQDLQDRTIPEGAPTNQPWHEAVVALKNAYERAEQLTDPRYRGSGRQSPDDQITQTLADIGKREINGG